MPIPGTEVALLNEWGDNFANVYLLRHIDEYPDVVLHDGDYFIVFKGDGPELARYQIDSSGRLPFGDIHELPVGHPEQPPRRYNDGR